MKQSSRLFLRDNCLWLKKTVGNRIPQVPQTDFLKVFARNRAGRMLLHIMGPLGIDVALQPSLFGNTLYQWVPSSGTSVPVSTFGGAALTNRTTGTGAALSHPAPASTDDYTSMWRTEGTTGTTATGLVQWQSAALPFFRGNAAGRGGFFLHCRFGISATSGTWQLLIGLSALNAALAGEPSAQNNTIALAKDSGDTNFQFLTRDGTTASKTDTGAAPALAAPYDFMMFAPPNGSNVTMRLTSAINGAVVADNTVKSANLPSSTTFMAAHFILRSASGTTGKVIGFNKMYVETDL